MRRFDEALQIVVILVIDSSAWLSSLRRERAHNLLSKVVQDLLE